MMSRLLLRLILLATSLTVWLLSIFHPFRVDAQIPDSSEIAQMGLREVKGKHLRLITDLPLDQEISQLPKVFDQAIPLWRDYFQLPIDHLDSWQAIAILMADRQKFKDLGILPKEIPDFKEGFQAGSQLYFMEQPSPYYRRHLLLHEGTHWFMARLFGGGGPPWFMEGMAEFLATHAWNGQQLRLGIMPSRTEDVPYWGRIRIIKEQLQSGHAPSLEKVLRMEGSARLEVEAYAWSWAAASFLTHHSDSKTGLKRVVGTRLDYSMRLNRDLYEELRDSWPVLKTAWDGFLSDLDYGYDLERALPKIDRSKILQNFKKSEVEVDASFGWQSSGLWVRQGERLRIRSQGRFCVGKSTKEWISEPQGITLRYHRGMPIGRLVACVVPVRSQGGIETAESWKVQSIGRDATLDIPSSGILMFQLNERPSDRSDNQGQCQVSIEKL